MFEIQNSIKTHYSPSYFKFRSNWKIKFTLWIRISIYIPGKVALEKTRKPKTVLNWAHLDLITQYVYLPQIWKVLNCHLLIYIVWLFNVYWFWHFHTFYKGLKFSFFFYLKNQDKELTEYMKRNFNQVRVTSWRALLWTCLKGDCILHGKVSFLMKTADGSNILFQLSYQVLSHYYH